jgi:hypothetical protein
MTDPRTRARTCTRTYEDTHMNIRTPTRATGAGRTR